MHQTRVMSILHVLFFCSGMASLACEVVWFKQLGFVLGSSTFSATVVVACFFGGLSVGSALFGRVADRVEHPLYAYGALELALAAASLLTTWTLSMHEQWVGWFTPYLSLESASARPLKVLLTLPILLPPTILMGATLPVLSRFVIRSRGELAARIGALYALNTLGAAVGCAVVGAVGIGLLGVKGSALVGSAIYALIGLVGLWLATQTPPPPPADEEPVAEGPLPSAWIALFAVSGFVAIGYEVLWFRMLRYFTAHTVYTFSTFLTIYLLGLVIGALACARWLAPRKDELAVSFARVQLGIGIAAIVSFAILGRSRFVLSLTSDYHALSGSSFLGLLLLSALVLLPPTILLGLAFPLVSELAVQSLRGLGARVGLLYGSNTLGGVLGSLVTGFLLLPVLGAQLSFVILIVCNFALFGAVWWMDARVRRRPEVLREAAGAVALLGVVLVLLGPNFLRASQTAFTGGDVLDFRENEDAAFVVMGYDEPHTGPYQQVIVNGTSYANNRPGGRRYMAMLGHLPVLLHEDPHQALVICVGTGTTIGAVSLYPQLDPVYAVDLTRHMFELAPHFVPINNSFHTNPRVRQVAADGRHFLLVADLKFDVLTFEPPPPQQAGVVNLYSREFYTLADKSLAPGGLIAQWIPFHAGYEDLQKSLIRTMSDSFPHVSLWMPSTGDGIAVASHSPLRLDPARLAARMSDPVIAADLAAVGIDSVEELLATFVVADQALSDWVGPVPVLTDDRPAIEYFFGYPDIRYRNAHLPEIADPLTPWLAGPVPDPEGLARARQQMQALLRAEDAELDQRWPEALAQAELALSLEPDDQYLRYYVDQLRESMD
jgi:spermidine synthase